MRKTASLYIVLFLEHISNIKWGIAAQIYLDGMLTTHLLLNLNFDDNLSHLVSSTVIK
jgi:hypothetical protein